MTQRRLPSYFLCHGGGPWPWMHGSFHDMFRGLERSLRAIPAHLPQRPRAILMVSAHWEETAFTVTSAPQPPMVYDYVGFPPETYAIRYPSPGAPALAERVVGLLKQEGLPAQAIASRGYDHGTYSVLKPMFPQADIPVVQLSLRTSLDPAEHLRAGAALALLRNENVLIIGSGMSSHGPRAEMAVASPLFDDWLQRTMQLRGRPREQALEAWSSAPHARTVHPREEHLLPLMVAVGCAHDEPASLVHGERLLGEVAISSFCFGRAERTAS